MFEKTSSVSSRAERIMNSFVRWKKMLHPVLVNISDNAGMVLNLEGRVHWKDKSVTGNEHSVKRPATVWEFCIHLHWGGWADSLIRAYFGWILLRTYSVCLAPTFRIIGLWDCLSGARRYSLINARKGINSEFHSKVQNVTLRTVLFTFGQNSGVCQMVLTCMFAHSKILSSMFWVQLRTKEKAIGLASFGHVKSKRNTLMLNSVTHI